MCCKEMAKWITSLKGRVVFSKEVDFQDCTILEFDKDTNKVSALVYSIMLFRV